MRSVALSGLLLRSIACSLEFAFQFSTAVAISGDGAAIPGPLSFSAVNAGRLGCMADVKGEVLNLSSLTGKTWSITTALDELDLDIIGIPAARLSVGFTVPGRQDLRVIARGGPSHSSVAVVWHATGRYQFVEVGGVGSNVRV